jgi:hypothetical protein
MSTVPIPVAGDTDENVVRYLNPTYEHQAFCRAVKNHHGDFINLVSHPYEFLENDTTHALMAFSADVMKQNLRWMQAEGYYFSTIAELITKKTT